MSMASNDAFEPVIGLEVHARLGLVSKLFCGDANLYGEEPNTLVSEIAMGYPGTLPVLNEKAIEFAVKIGLACESTIASTVVFDRKNYFYPDLPKGYQVTQDRLPICLGGKVKIKMENEFSEIALTKIHLEEDAGKSIHGANGVSFIDYNRAGTALIEIVTEPVLKNANEAHSFLYEIRRLIRYLEIGDANMEEGSLRCDANISIRPVGSSELGSKVEIKNMNSFNNVKRAIVQEISRQENIIVGGGRVISETRSFNPDTGESVSMREKETLADYRYFPEPDLSPVQLTKEWVDKLKDTLPELPLDKEIRYRREYLLSEYDAALLSRSKMEAWYFEKIVNICDNPKAAANWMMGPIASVLNASGMNIQNFPISPEKIGHLIKDIESERYSYSHATKTIFPLLIEEPNLSIEQLLNKMEDSGDELDMMINDVLIEFPKEVVLYKKGNKKVLGMLMGQVMKKAGRTADPKKAKELLENALNIG